VDSPDSHELRRLLIEAGRRSFASTPFRRDALISATLRTGRALGWWLTEPDHSFPGGKDSAKGSAAVVEQAFSDLAERGVLIEAKGGYWSFAAATLEEGR
jgi:hypothetical protein